ncbi:hypothetical protein ACJ4V0_09625 [Phreatobacter sp. HK31-P]
MKASTAWRRMALAGSLVLVAHWSMFESRSRSSSEVIGGSSSRNSPSSTP